MFISGHDGLVNSVSWSPSVAGRGHLLATASDDHTVRIWAAKDFQSTDTVFQVTSNINS